MEPLAWTHPVRAIPKAGLDLSREADEHERAALTAALEVLGCDRLLLRYGLRHIGADRLRLTGTIEAELTQACVITLEPVKRFYALPLSLELWPAEAIEAAATTEIESLDDDPEPIVNGIADIGRIVVEELISGIDLYPRADGESDPAGAASAAAPEPAAGMTRPFAGLDRLLAERKPR